MIDGRWPNSLISFGAGVNSTAMVILLVNNGWRGPVVFADTGCEWPETYCHLRVFGEWLRERGLEIVTLGKEYRSQVPSRDERSLLEYCEGYRITPMAGSRWCTVGWKVDLIRQYAKEHDIAMQYIGIAADEWHRKRDLSYPLIERGITRQDCVKIIRTAGLDVPQKSGCYICPFQRTAQWRELYRRHPELYEQAANLERISTARRGRQTHIRPGSDYTLDELQMQIDAQGTFFDDAEWDNLLAYKPCICGV